MVIVYWGKFVPCPWSSDNLYLCLCRTVYLSRRIVDNKEVIIKEIPVEQMTKEERQAALNEVKVLSMLDHPNIIQYNENFLEDKALMIVMEYAQGTNFLIYWIFLFLSSIILMQICLLVKCGCYLYHSSSWFNFVFVCCKNTISLNHIFKNVVLLCKFYRRYHVWLPTIPTQSTIRRGGMVSFFSLITLCTIYKIDNVDALTNLIDLDRISSWFKFMEHEKMKMFTAPNL